MPTESSRGLQELLVKQLTRTDRVEVYLLDPSFEAQTAWTFPVPSQRPETDIVDSRSLAGESMTRILALWTELLEQKEGYQLHCHYPIHGLRFYGVEGMLFETSVCWVCNNFYTETGGRFVWIGMPGDSPTHPENDCRRRFRQAIESLLPIPKGLVEKVRPQPGKGYSGRKSIQG
jgi:hypothetical protein